MPKIVTTESLINDFLSVHGDRYDYSKVLFKSSKIKVAIICFDHGLFYQRPDAHKKGQHCPICARGNQSKTITENFLRKRNSNISQPDDYKLVFLSCGRFAKVDNEDFDVVSKINWNYHQGYCKNHSKGLMHRFIMKCPKNKVVDHINHDTLDNRRINLRICTQQQNNFNRKPINKSISEYKGVFYDNKSKKWRSCITFNGKKIHIGYFDKDVDAAIAYDLKSKDLYGEFAYLNIK